MAASSVSRSKGAAALPRALAKPSTGVFLGLAMLSAVQAWEWLFSGLTKLQNDAFIRGFVSFVSHAPGPYGRLMTWVVSAAPGLIPGVVEATELGLGIALLLAAGLVLVPFRRVRTPAIYTAGAASLIGALTATNIAILVGDRPPWTLSPAPFGPGVPVEALLAGISIAGLAEAYSAWRITRT
jgi:hypothetical protein